MAAATMAAGMRRLQAAMRKLGAKYNGAMNRAMTSTAMRAREIMVGETDAKRAVNTAYYRRAWKAEKLANYTIRVFNDATYAGVIEKGRRPQPVRPPRPGRPRRPKGSGPIPMDQLPPFRKAIVAWTMRKFRLPYKAAYTRMWAISNAINRRGLPARNVLEDAKPKLRQAMTEEFTREITSALRTP